MKSKISLLILKILGWKVNNYIPIDNIKKGVIIMAPHTSNLDFIIGRLFFYAFKMKVHFLIKKELFVFPIGYILKKIGGIPVDRSKANKVINKVINDICDNENYLLVITPEGSRSYRKYWKKGFYYIALKTNTPIIISYIDYNKKTGTIHSLFYPTGDIKSDFQKISSLYQNITPKYPEKFCNKPKIKL